MSKLINFKEDFSVKSSVVSFGNFDGVHIGHKEILGSLISKSKYYNASSIVIIFNPHIFQTSDTSISDAARNYSFIF